MTLTEKKAAALAAYKGAKRAYAESMSKSDWIKFCDAKRVCMRLGVII